MSAVSLTPNSAYIATQHTGHGSFHWALIITDGNSLATRHHWAQETSTSARETYKRQPLGTLASISHEGRAYLGFFRIDGWMTPPDDILHSACIGVFSESFPTPAANRMHGISCRTWLFGMLQTLFAKRYIKRKKGLVGVEAGINNQSKALYQKLTSPDPKYAKQPWISAVVDV